MLPTYEDYDLLEKLIAICIIFYDWYIYDFTIKCLSEGVDIRRNIILTCNMQRVSDKPASHPDLDSKYQVNSSTQPWKNAFPVTVSRHSEGNGFNRSK